MEGCIIKVFHLQWTNYLFPVSKAEKKKSLRPLMPPSSYTIPNHNRASIQYRHSQDRDAEYKITICFPEYFGDGRKIDDIKKGFKGRKRKGRDYFSLN